MKKVVYIISLFFVCLAPQLFAADKAGVISRDTELFSKPFKDSEIISELAAQTAIVILKRKGGWYEIKTEKQQGWVRLTHIRLARKANTKQDTDNNVGEILSELATGRDKSDEVTTATAIKGLSEEELRNAEPDVEALDALESFAADENIGNASGLAARKVDYLEGDGPNGKKETANSTETNDEDEEE